MTYKKINDTNIVPITQKEQHMARVSNAAKVEREAALMDFFRRNPLATGREANDFLKNRFGQGMNPNTLYEFRRQVLAETTTTDTTVTTTTTV